MSYITIHVYDGDSEAFDDNDEPGTVGNRIDGEERSFSDGEELDAAQEIIGLLNECKHFDVRQWTN
jgi:hypothetical protein